MMTNEQREEISVLAEDYTNKRMRIDCLAMMNTYGKTHEELTKMATAYHIADAEMREAYSKLEAAKAPTCS